MMTMALQALVFVLLLKVLLLAKSLLSPKVHRPEHGQAGEQLVIAAMPMDLPPFRSKLVDCRLLEIFCIRAQARNFIFGDVAPVQFPPVLGSFEDDCGGVGLELFFTDGFVSDRVGFRKLSGWPKRGGGGGGATRL